MLCEITQPVQCGCDSDKKNGCWRHHSVRISTILYARQNIRTTKHISLHKGYCKDLTVKGNTEKLVKLMTFKKLFYCLNSNF